MAYFGLVTDIDLSESPGPRRWVPGADLAAASDAPALSPRNAAAWRADIADAADDDAITDPWERQRE